VQMDIRWADGDARETRRHAGELVALAPDVILTAGDAGMPPLLQATRTIPIVFNNVADRSAPASSTAWRGRAATLPAFSSSNIA
jgi:ABC-type uncharacterized transport system substrate-binding protein